MSQNALVLQAIALKQCVVATYNRTQVRLAPHILYTRHDELYLDAVTKQRDGQPPREVKIGTFKLTGLQDLALAADQPFEPESIFDPSSEKYQGVTLFAVELN